MTERPTTAELAAIDKLARAMQPEAWREFDAGRGICSNEAGWRCRASVVEAKRLIRAFPTLVAALDALPGS